MIFELLVDATIDEASEKPLHVLSTSKAKWRDII